LKVLVLTSLYPNAVQSNLGIFVENRLRAVIAEAKGAVQAHVVAPVPWFPSSHSAFRRYAQFACIPKQEERYGITIDHPRYLMIPKFGERIQSDTYVWAVRQYLKGVMKKYGRFDLIDAHFFYPDGVAAAQLAQELDIPLMITARGSDISDYTTRLAARKRIIQAAEIASHNTAVCQALKSSMVDIGMDEDKITVLRNGIDLQQFRPLPEVKRPDTYFHIVSVGALVERKGHHLTIEAIADLPNIHLSIAGAGSEEHRLRTLIDKLSLGNRVKLLGSIPHDKLAELYNSAHLSVLSSSREGWANVLLESLACGTPVAATAIWGTPEVMTSPDAGVLIQERNVACIRDGIKNLMDNLPERTHTRLYAEQFSWQETAQKILHLFEKIVKNHSKV
jgi:teichuronic acid biosynthesis glycosyltransferase TuaC